MRIYTRHMLFSNMATQPVHLFAFIYYEYIYNAYIYLNAYICDPPLGEMATQLICILSLIYYEHIYKVYIYYTRIPPRLSLLRNGGATHLYILIYMICTGGAAARKIQLSNSNHNCCSISNGC